MAPARTIGGAVLALCAGTAAASAPIALTVAEESGTTRLLVRGDIAGEPSIGFDGSAPGGRWIVLRFAARGLPPAAPAVPQGQGPIRSIRVEQTAQGQEVRLKLAPGHFGWLRRSAGGWAVLVLPEAVQAGVAANVPGAPASPPPARTQPVEPAVATKRGADAPEVLLVDISVNGVKGQLARVEQREEGLVLALEDWRQARLLTAGAALTMTDGSEGYALDAIGGIRYRLDRGNLSLDVQAPPAALASSTIGDTLAGNAALGTATGVMVNYDVSATRVEGRSADSAALVEAVGLHSAGTFLTSMVARDDGTRREVHRLDTAWQHDMPERMEKLVLGDTIGVGGGWSLPARYAGVRWGRDFSMQPGFVSFPLPSLRGEATVPSTVDLLVDNVRRLSTPVPTGPFELRNVPLVTGAGEYNLVVRDLLGRETVLRQSYYASPRLLAPGVTDFSVEAGVLRTGWGRDSRYGEAFSAATWRTGVTPSLTLEARTELQRERQAAGVEVAGLVGGMGSCTRRGCRLPRDRRRGTGARGHDQGGRGAAQRGRRLLAAGRRRTARVRSFRFP